MSYLRPNRISLSIMPVLHLLPHRLRLVSILKSSLPSVTYSLLQLTLKLLGQPSSRANHFFSFTETKSDFSLILDIDLFKELSNHEFLQIAGDIWRPLTVEVGAYGSLTGISKIAANVIGPLADENVSVFCLSTNQEDYVMVKEKDLYKALYCLSSCFKIITKSKQDVDLITRIESAVINMDVPVNDCDPPSPRPITHPFTYTGSKFHVCSILPSTLSVIAQPLLQLMFFNSRSEDTVNDTFFSLSIIKDDVSMVVDSKDVDKFPEDCVYSSEAYWKVITIGDSPLGFDECGIVAQVAAPLAQAEISTFYICTFYNDHTLVPENSVIETLKILNKYLVSHKRIEATPTYDITPPHSILNEPFPQLITNALA